MGLLFVKPCLHHWGHVFFWVLCYVFSQFSYCRLQVRGFRTSSSRCLFIALLPLRFFRCLPRKSVCIENQARELVGSRTLATPQSFCMSFRQRSGERTLMDLGGLSKVYRGYPSKCSRTILLLQKQPRPPFSMYCSLLLLASASD